MKCVEDALREIRGKAAVVEYLANCAAESQRIAEAEMFNGLGDICEEIAGLAEKVQDALTADALGAELARK